MWLRGTARCHGIDIHDDSPPRSYGTVGVIRTVTKATDEPDLEEYLKTRPMSAASTAAVPVGSTPAFSPGQSLVGRQIASTGGSD